MTRRSPLPIGHRFGRLVVIGLDHHNPKRGAYFLSCRCDCGASTVVREDCLKTGNTRSCGCLQPESVHSRHGMHKTRTYHIWAGMLSRCRPSTKKKAHLYSGKGIKVCDRWSSFENFLDDMGEAPAGMSIDRINGNGDYERENCRWATSEEQANNTTQNRFLSHAGQRMTISQWAHARGIKPNTLLYRVRRGWAIDRALGYA